MNVAITEETTDAELVKLALADNKDAFRLLIERYQVMAICLTVRFTRNVEIARELVQEAMLQAYLSLDKLHDATRFKSWFYSITLNICRNWLRTHKEILSLDTQEGSQLLEQSSCLIQDPQEQLVTQEIQQIVGEAVRMLSTPYRDVAYLFYYEEMSMQKIAHHLHISLPAVKSRLHRGRKQLRQHLNALYPEEVYSTTAKRQRRTLLRTIFTGVIHPRYARADLVFLLHTQRHRTSSLLLQSQEQTAAGKALPDSTRQDVSAETDDMTQQSSASNQVNIRSKYMGGTMQNDQGRSFRFSAIWAGIIILGLPLSLGLAQLITNNTIKLISLGLTLSTWFAFCVALAFLTRGLRKHKIFNMGYMLPLVLPLVILLFIVISTFHIARNLGLDDSGSLLIAFALLAAWSSISILLSRTARSRYLALHALNWLFWLGMAIALAPWQLYASLYMGMTGLLAPWQILLFLAFPLSISLVLLSFYKTIIQRQQSFFQRGNSSSVMPKSDNQQSYEQGYRQSYSEGGTIYTYASQHEEPVAGYPWQDDMLTMKIEERP
ncbi:sigma-70 family RNA polymerase sigma factor [Ktedonosporobacter rubrisoli]|uniref:Sigma-70 family RNA polymerase sigma factor n=1 Tax=Ktedonosporobacter rubrisoli TaxID=2509675 RepID=A0A4P6JZ88_KTERU|nr:sigma-70 family RNA polymerase sigma factor [Ktedonosporobacter rubrisoli]QBD80812.1 sigma-70 family RNA polymerase sigma factor [Ktedonosporobacter rubrisoli]